MADFNRHDLEFILQQIEIAEAHAAGGDLADLTINPNLPLGLRTIDGFDNNTVPGTPQFGASDQVFPRLLDPVFRDAEFGTNYLQTSGAVIDSEPRIISNLVVDQSADNPAALDASGGEVDPIFGDAVIPNTAPDEGLSAPFNAWFTFFGQFFDHGLDLVNKGGSGVVIMPLEPDDPLFVPGSPTNFIPLSRATNLPGPDGVVGDDPLTLGVDESLDDIHEHVNQTTPFVDQNQTYTSHSSHHVFLRAYEDRGGQTVPTGEMLEGAAGGLSNWAEVKAQAANLLGILLTDADVTNIPLLLADQYGNYIPGPNGLPQIVTGPNPGDVVEGNIAAPVDPTAIGALRIGHAFLDDIAFAAVPRDGDGNLLTEDADGVAGPPLLPPAAGEYDNELLDLHFITGDGRGNENIALSAVHHVFHSEHNRLVGQTQDEALASGDVDFLNQWLDTPVAAVPTTPAGIAALEWNGGRLLQAAKFGTEMQYQHLVFEEFARKVQPAVNAFSAIDTEVDPSIVAEFAHTVYRFGHSMLNNDVARLDPNYVNTDIGLIEAFTNPVAFFDTSLDANEAAGALARGLTRQTGNQIDEFVIDAVRNNLLGLPLDLPAINIARGRDTGIPGLNDARTQFFEMTGDTTLKPYISWVDFALHAKSELSVVNFIAAYGQHPTITGATNNDDRRAAAMDIAGIGLNPQPADSIDFLNSTGAWATAETGLNLVDFWIGGLAEAIMPFGGMLGSSFNFVFETQLEALQEGDRFYYLARTAGLNFLTELENNSFAGIIMEHTDAVHLPGDVFSSPNYFLEVDQSIQFNEGMGNADPTAPTIFFDMVIRDNPETVGPDTDYLRFTGGDHVTLGGTPGDDIIIGGIGDDTLWGDEGNDRLEGGDGADIIVGGDGNDILTDLGGEDVIQGQDGNDYIHGGNSEDLILGGGGDDFINGGEDLTEIFGGDGDDLIFGGDSTNTVFGGEGDDWIEGGSDAGDQADLLQGDNGDPFGISTIIGNDVLIGGAGNDDFDAESGDDIMFGGPGTERFEGHLGFDWVTYRDDALGIEADMNLRQFGVPNVPPSPDAFLERFDMVEGLSGSPFADVLRAEDVNAALLVGNELTTDGIALIDGLQELLGAGVTSFTGGNIVLGGDGSDSIQGRGGDDIIDGDAWLNARLEYQEAGSPNDGLTFDRMAGFEQMVYSGELDPGNINIVREILDLAGDPISNTDTAVYAGLAADYTVTQVDANTWTVTDNVGTEGTDTLHNIERLQFNDQIQVLFANGNSLPMGALLILGTVAEGQTLTADISAVTDADNVSSGGAITGDVDYVWQVELEPGTGIFSDIIIEGDPTLGGEVVLARGEEFIPSNAEVGLALRVRANFLDENGVLEHVMSAPTDVVLGDGINVAPTGLPLIDDTTPTEGQVLTANIDGIMDGDGLNTAVFTFQWQRDPGTGFVDIAGAVDEEYTPVLADRGLALRVVTMFTDDGGTMETVASAATAPVGSLIIGTAGNDFGGQGAGNLVGTPFADEIQGLGGRDDVFAGDGDDLLVGAGGADRLNGEGGNDTINAGGGRDRVNGGDGDDIINGGGGNDDLQDGLQGGAGNDTIDGGNGNDWILGQAGMDNLIGGNGNDTLFGGDGFDMLSGDAGDDRLVGGEGNDTLDGGGGFDDITGGAGNDVMRGGALEDRFEFLTGFGDDIILDFDSDPTVGDQDFLLIGGVIDPARFGLDVAIIDQGADTLVDLAPDGLPAEGGSILLIGVDAATVTVDDFIF